MNILFYYPSNKRTISIETAILALQKEGHTLSLLTIVDHEGPLHEILKANGIQASSYVIRKKNFIQYHFSHIIFLLRFIKTNKIEYVFSHIQYVNTVAVFAQYFTKAKFAIFRHHDYPKNLKERIADWIINRLSKKMVTPAESIKKRMLEIERVKPNKIRVIPYIYDFEKYHYSLDTNLVNTIRATYNAKLLLVIVSRLVPEKRHLYLIQAINELVIKGFDIKLLILDEGTEKEGLQNFVHTNKLENNIFFMGFQKNVLSYIAASDILVHPSVAEASCSVVKEAGLLERIVIACRGVGDFDDYITNNQNGILLSQTDNGDEINKVLIELYNNYSSYAHLGSNLKKDVIHNFSVSDRTLKMYSDLLNE